MKSSALGPGCSLYAGKTTMCRELAADTRVLTIFSLALEWAAFFRNSNTIQLVIY